MFYKAGNYYNDKDLEVISDGKRYFVLDGWNGLQYCDCWEVADEEGFDPIGTEKYSFGPVYLKKDENEYELIGYEENEESHIISSDEHPHKTDNELKELPHIEFNVTLNGCSYCILYGEYVNGYFCCIPSENIACDMAEPVDIFYNYESLEQIGVEDELATKIASTIKKLYDKERN